jgi:hypothetical protein
MKHSCWKTAGRILEQSSLCAGGDCGRRLLRVRILVLQLFVTFVLLCSAGGYWGNGRFRASIVVE